MSKITLACVACLAAAATPAFAVINQVKNGGFESPVVVAPVPGYLQVERDSTQIDSWVVAHDPLVKPEDPLPEEEVALVSGTYAEVPYRFPAAEGAQWLDLTGLRSNRPVGVQQTILVKPGNAYLLTFSVGNMYDPGGIFGVDSTVDVLIDGVHGSTATNDLVGSAPKTMAWKTFTVVFYPKYSTATVAFFNRDPKTDNCNGLDGVSVVQANTIRPAPTAPTTDE